MRKGIRKPSEKRPTLPEQMRDQPLGWTPVTEEDEGEADE